MYARELKRQAGFTLLEAITVLVLLSTLSSLLFVHWSPGATLSPQADQLARTLRHAQSLALSQGRRFTFDVESATSYAITDGVSAVTDLQGVMHRYTLAGGTALAGSDINFDSLGRPIDAGGDLIAGALTWTLSAGGSASSVSMQPLTGFITITP